MESWRLPNFLDSYHAPKELILFGTSKGEETR